MKRRAFIGTAMAGTMMGVWARGEVGGDGTPPPDTVKARELARKYAALMKEKSLKEHARLGLTYPTSYGTSLYDWELFFDGLALIYFGMTEPAKNGIRIFLDTQRDDGFICRRTHENAVRPEDPVWQKIWDYESEEHCKPFLAQLALMASRAEGDASWLAGAPLEGLARYLDHWLTAWDQDENGLSEWNSGPHSGADTQLKRVGTWRSRHCEGADLNSFLYKECIALATLAKALGASDMAARFEAAADVKRVKFQTLWDEEDGFFYDRDIRDGSAIRVKTAAAFLSLWAGLATKEQAETLVKRHLLNPEEFWRPLPVAAYAKSEPEYAQRYDPPEGADIVYALTPGHANWVGGMWPHWNYLIVHGLVDYGYMDEARAIAAKWFAAAAAPEGLYEWYNAETGAGAGVNPFWAGSSVLGVLLPAELDLRLNPTAAAPPSEPLGAAKLRDRLGLAETNPEEPPEN